MDFLRLLTLGVLVATLGLFMVFFPKRLQAMMIDKTEHRPGSVLHTLNEGREARSTTIVIQLIGAGALVMGSVALYQACR